MLKKVLGKTRLSRWMRYSVLIGSGATIAGGFIVSETRFRTNVSFDESNSDDCLENNKAPTYIEASLVKLLPLKIISRVWGHVNSYELPERFREPVFRTFCDNYNCVLSEAETEDLKQFRNLKEFFTRTLKSELRPISDKIIASPCDGTIINYGPIVDNRVDQVKGATYSLSSFFGPITWRDEKNDSSKGKSSKDSKDNEKAYPEQLLHSPENQLYQTVVYLAPGDYHRFHSPVDWHVKFRRHFSGKLFFVKPCFANWLNDLFSLNERALYIGEWTHGFFSMCAIGAANVGSIEIYFDNILKTNKLFHRKYLFRDRTFDEDIVPEKGEPFGQFNLGSTVVVIFEAPKNFKFDLKLGQRIKYGQPIGFTDK